MPFQKLAGQCPQQFSLNRVYENLLPYYLSSFVI